MSCGEEDGKQPLPSIVRAVADAALSSAFPDCDLLRWVRTGDAAGGAFSGSAVLELRDEVTGQRVILKHSVARVDALPADAGVSARLRAERTDRSSKNEVAFLAAYGDDLMPPKKAKSREITMAGELVIEQQLPPQQCRIPRTLYARASDAEGCTILMESLSHWSPQVAVVPSGTATRATLRWLASFHAAFLPAAIGGGGLPLARLATGGGWEAGTHIELRKRPASELEGLPRTLGTFAASFAEADAYFGSAAAQAQGARLQAVAERAAEGLRPGGGGAAEKGQHCTMVQGDYKQGNMMFRAAGGGGQEGGDGGDGGDVEPGLAIFDWQWTGPGVGATDVVYLCAMALSDDTLDNYERDVLAVYHEYLCIALGAESAESGANGDGDDNGDDDDDDDGHEHDHDENGEDVREEKEEGGVEVVAQGGGRRRRRRRRRRVVQLDAPTQWQA